MVIFNLVSGKIQHSNIGQHPEQKKLRDFLPLYFFNFNNFYSILKVLRITFIKNIQFYFQNFGSIASFPLILALFKIGRFK